MREKLPKGYIVKERLFQSPLNKDYIAVCSTKRKEQTALVYFDGISDIPFAIYTYWAKPIYDSKE